MVTDVWKKAKCVFILDEPTPRKSALNLSAVGNKPQHAAVSQRVTEGK
jgi:hypothetical protein